MTPCFRLLAALLALPMLSACAALGPNPDTPLGQCQRQALNDPTVNNLMARSVAGTSFAADNAGRLNAAKQQAVQACMRQKGLAPPGGVEPVQPLR